MPDMQTEVKKIIAEWSAPELKQEVAPVVSKPFPERIFDYIKANPQCTLKKIRDSIMSGVKDDSALTNALKNLYDRQLIGRHLVDNPDFKGTGRRKVFVYWAVINAYTSKPVKRRGRPKGKVTKVVAKKKSHEVVVHKPFNPQPSMPRMETGFSAEAVVSRLNIYEAKKVWEMLNEVFGK